MMAIIQLADDGQQRHFKQDCVQPGTADGQLQLVIVFADVDKARLQMKQAQKFDEIVFQVALAGEKIKLGRAQLE